MYVQAVKHEPKTAAWS